MALDSIQPLSADYADALTSPPINTNTDKLGYSIVEITNDTDPSSQGFLQCVSQRLNKEFPDKETPKHLMLKGIGMVTTGLAMMAIGGLSATNPNDEQCKSTGTKASWTGLNACDNVMSGAFATTGLGGIMTGGYTFLRGTYRFVTGNELPEPLKEAVGGLAEKTTEKASSHINFHKRA